MITLMKYNLLCNSPLAITSKTVSENITIFHQMEEAREAKQKTKQNETSRIAAKYGVKKGWQKNEKKERKA